MAPKRLRSLVPALLLVSASCSSTSVNAPAEKGGQGGAEASLGGGGASGGAAATGATGASGGASGAAGAAAGADAGGDACSDSVGGASNDGGMCHSYLDPPSCTGAVNTCPADGQTIKWTCVDSATGSVELYNQADSRTYWCSVVYDKPGDCYNCETDPTVGNQEVITSLSVVTGCACGNTITLGFPRCSFMCKATN